MWMSLTGRTFGTFCSQGMRIWFSPGKAGSLGRLACKGGLWPIRYRTSRKTVPVKFLLTLSTRRDSCSVVLCLGRNPNCSSHSNPRSFTSRRTLSSRIFSKSLPTVSSRLMGLWEEGSVGSFPGFSMDTTRACFHADGKYCLRRTALNTFVRKVNALLGRCLRALFVIPFWPGALPTLSPLMACGTSEGLVKFCSLAGAYSYARIYLELLVYSPLYRHCNCSSTYEMFPVPPTINRKLGGESNRCAHRLQLT
jgi:hypothetical protein